MAKVRMNEDPTLVGQAYLDRKATKEELQELAKKLDRQREILERTGTSIATRNEANFEIDLELPTARDILSLVRREAQLQSKLTELSEFLELAPTEE